MLLDTISRIQFGFTISFHILFPAFSIGLITFIAILEGAWLKTRNPHYRNICMFWTKILALTFGMGIVSGIVMEFQLGTNWANFTRQVGSVLGVLFTYEVLTAFFIEAGFLGIMFFGWNRVNPKLHYASTLLALFGVTLSAFWIMSANSWMQTPAGAVFDGHIFKAVNWVDVIFNPSFVPRYLHMLLSTYISSFLVIGGVSAYYLLNKKHLPFAKTCLSFVMWSLIIMMPLQILMGDEVGLKVLEYQPLKTAAMEGIWDTQKGAPLVLFAWPNAKTEKNDYAITIPKLAALINTHEWNGELVGLKSVPAAERPPVAVVFWSFRIMVGLGLLMLLVAFLGLILRYKGKLYRDTWFLKLCILISPIGFVSIIMGWFTAEFGRQPWIVYHFLKRADALSPILLHQVIISFLSIVFVYGIIFGYFYFLFFIRAIKSGPSEDTKLLDQPFFYMSPIIGKLEAKNNQSEE
ncbi:MAG: cytochrome ubiquinol oxidase subunit I [Gammaproteobacteria bacterium]|nr:cytochrome ubiquinol oxidase subunit I [Gammaproteobacteria bacterium]